MSDSKAPTPRRDQQLLSSARTLRDVAALVAAGLVAPDLAPALRAVAATHRVAVPPALVGLIDRADPFDPIARQVVPSVEELALSPEELADPIGDQAFSPLKGLVHRYGDRVLLAPVLVCPVYCRFCFRRQRVGEGSLSADEIAAALAYVAARPEVREVILTGGDPLMLGPGRLRALVDAIAAIGHVEVIRVHTRLPIADPARLGAVMVRALRPRPAKAVWVALHVNHPREVSPAVATGLARLADAGIPLLAQTVLLKGVNDDPAVLETLFRALVRHRVKPYYLHHPDRARGTGHFRLTLAEGRNIVAQLRRRLTGIALPTYVLDIPGGAGKVPVGPDYWNPADGTVGDREGNRHPYEPVGGTRMDTDEHG